MSYISSLETTLARSVANDLEAGWKGHKQGCPKCSRRRDRCRIGDEIFRDLAAARAELVLQRHLDKMPSPDQGELF